jgi:hypothetical protein
MKKKVRKFASGGDVLTAAGALLLGKHLYDKYKGKDDDDKAKLKYDEDKGSVPTDKSDYSGKNRSTLDSADAAARKRAEDTSKGRPELVPEGADEAVMRSDNYPTPKPKPAVKKPTAATTPAKKASTASESSNTTPSTYYTPPPKKPTVSKSGVKGAQSVGEAFGMISPGEAKGTQTLGERVRGTIDSAGKSVVRTPQQRMADAAREVEERRKKEAGMRRGGAVKKYASGGSVSSASKRADGIAQRGKTRGKVC